MQKVKVPKLFKKPSVVVICKKSIRLILIFSIVITILLILALIFKLFAYFITDIGAILVSIKIFKKIYRCFYFLYINLGDFYAWYLLFQEVFGFGEKKLNTNSLCKIFIILNLFENRENCVQLKTNIKVAREFLE